MVIISGIRNVLQSAKLADLPILTKRNMAKEMLIYHILEWIYNHPTYRKLKFYGGTCARVVYGLNRLSEDIDLDNGDGIDLSSFGSDLLRYLRGVLLLIDVEVKNAIDREDDQSHIWRFLIKLPILHALDLSTNPTEKLHIKIEISAHRQIAKTNLTPIVTNGHSMVVRHWDENSLMAGKILACLNRSFVKGKTGIDYKGRDYYDLLWYMQRGIRPYEQKILTESDYANMDEVWQELRQRIKLIKPADIAGDLENLFMERDFAKIWSEQMHGLFEKYISQT